VNACWSVSDYTQPNLPEKAELCFVNQGNSVRCGFEPVSCSAEGCCAFVTEAKLAFRNCLVCLMAEHHSPLYVTYVSYSHPAVSRINASVIAPEVAVRIYLLFIIILRQE